MQTIDIVITVLLTIGLVSGLHDGLVKQVASLVGFIAGLLLGRAFCRPVGDALMSLLGMSVEVAHVVAFILILILVPLLFSMVAWLVTRVLRAICLGWMNRLLGGLVGVVKLALFTGLLITAIEVFDRHDALLSEEHKAASIFYYPLYRSTGIFFDQIKEELFDAGANVSANAVHSISC